MLFAVYLLSKKQEVYKIPCLWCQKRDLNSRPPAYETESINTDGILAQETYKKLNTAL